MRSFEHLLIRRQGQGLRHQVLGLFFMGTECLQKKSRIAVFKVVGGLLFFILQIDVAVAQCLGPFEVVYIVDTLQVHGQPL